MFDDSFIQNNLLLFLFKKFEISRRRERNGRQLLRERGPAAIFFFALPPADVLGHFLFRLPRLHTCILPRKLKINFRNLEKKIGKGQGRVINPREIY